MKFAKLFEIDEQTQVLVIRALDEEEDIAPYKLKVSTDYRGILAEAGYGYRDETKCDNAFDEYDLTQATTFYNGIVEAIEQED